MKKKTSGNSKRTLLDIPYTQRDIKILEFIYEKRYTTTPQIWACFFAHTKNKKVCQQRLAKLHEYGLVRVIDQAVKRGEGRKPYIYALDKLGAELLAYERGIDLKSINTKPRADEDKSLSIKHLLATTDFQVALLLACAFTGITLEEWLDERSIRSQRMKEKITLAGPQGEVLKLPIPDALFTLMNDERRAILHLEADRATEDIQLSTFERQSIAGKVIEYLLWRESEAYRQVYETRPLRVLFVTVGPRRMQNMCKAAEQMIRQHVEAQSDLPAKEKEAKILRLCRQFRFITFDQLNPETLLTQPVWQIAGHEELSTLFNVILEESSI